MQRALDDRLAVSEAIDAVGRMLRGFNQAKDKSYVGAMAEYLTRFPRGVALACADPFDGVVAGTKYLPTPSEVIAFCERRMRPMLEARERELRVAEQLRQREEYERESVADSLKESGRRWLDRTDPVAREVSGQRPKGPPTKDEVEALLAAVRSTAAELNAGTVKLSALALASMRARDAVRDMDDGVEP